MVEKGTVASVVLVLEYPGSHLQISDPHLVTIQGYNQSDETYRVNWGYGRGGASYKHSEGDDLLPNSFKIIKIYGHEDDEESYWVQFDKDNPPVESIPTEQGNGWLSPNGKWYGCGYGGHDGLADRLFSVFYDGGSGRYNLQEKGWVNVYDSGLMPYDVKPTDNQIKTLNNMFLFGDEEWKKHISDYLEYWERKKD